MTHGIVRDTQHEKYDESAESPFSVIYGSNGRRTMTYKDMIVHDLRISAVLGLVARRSGELT